MRTYSFRGRSVPIYLVEMWVPKDGKVRECFEVSRKILEYIRAHRNEFKERRSHRLFRVFVGSRPWFIDVQEYDDLRSMEELDKKVARDKQYLELINEWKKCIDSKETRSLILFDVHRDLWVE